MNDIVIPSTVLITLALTIIGKIVYDWLKNTRTQTPIRGPVNGSSIPHYFESQIRLCNTQFADIRKEFERGNDRFGKLDDKLDAQHHEIMSELICQNKRIGTLEAKLDNM